MANVPEPVEQAVPRQPNRTVAVGAVCLLIAALSGWAAGGWWFAPGLTLGAAAAAVIGAIYGAAWLRWAGLLTLLPATGLLLVRESYPHLLGATPSPMAWRAAAFLLAALALGAAARAMFRVRGGEETAWWLTGAAGLVAFWYITLEVTLAYDTAHNGMIAGHESLAVTAAWGLFGLTLALLDRRWPHQYLRYASRAVMGAGLTFLLVGALLANARWADPEYRFFAYAALFGSIWAAEYLFERRPEDWEIQGILSQVAALGGFFVIAFEIVRWLEPAFTHPVGVLLSLAEFEWQRSMLGFWRIASWSLYGLGLVGAGASLRSPRTRLLGLGGLGLSLVYGLFLAATNPAAITWVRWLAFAAAVGGTAVAGLMTRRAVSVVALVAGVAWVALELL